MDLREYRLFFIVVTFVVALLVASPALQRLLVYPRTEFFSEIWLLGQNHKAEGYPYNVTRNQSYSIYLGIGNQLGKCAYYNVEVKLRNSSQSAPTSFGPLENRTPSTLPSLYNVTAVVADQTTWERLLEFSFDYTYDNASDAIQFGSMMLNDVTLDLSHSMTSWNSTVQGYRESLVFELWIYNATSNAFQYHSRASWLWFNMTTV